MAAVVGTCCVFHPKNGCNVPKGEFLFEQEKIQSIPPSSTIVFKTAANASRWLDIQTVTASDHASASL